MKPEKNKIILMAAIIGLSMSTTSCSIFKPSDKKESQGKGLQGWVQTGEESADNAAETVKETAKKTGGRVKKSSEKNIAEVNEKNKNISDGITDSDVTGDWAIETVFGKKAIGETAPFIKFVSDEKRVYGNNGCNVLNAQYEINTSKKTISFSNLATTMMLCAESSITDAEIGEALGSTKSFSIQDGSPDKIMTFYNAAGQPLMTLMHRDFHFLDGTWAVVAIDGENVDIDDMKIALDVDEKRMHGNTGCNIINGELETDMDTANSISFSKIAMTKMACPNSGWETRMTMALEEAITARKINKDEIEFVGSNGQQVMLLKKTSPIEE